MRLWELINELQEIVEDNEESDMEVFFNLQGNLYDVDTVKFVNGQIELY